MAKLRRKVYIARVGADSSDLWAKGILLWRVLSGVPFSFPVVAFAEGPNDPPEDEDDEDE